MDRILTCPENIGIIMDGNGRWAQARGLARTAGHTEGMKNLIRLAAHAFERGAKSVTCYSMSTENLHRPADEVQHILGLVSQYAEPFVKAFYEKRVCAKFVGDLSLLPHEVRDSLEQTERTLSVFDGLGRTLYIAIAYGSRAEIVRAVNEAVRAGTPVTEESLLSALGLPMNLDLVIRTGGEQRLSNFFLYQCAYSELYFSDQYFPDFTTKDLDDVLAWYNGRTRRYGLL